MHNVNFPGKLEKFSENLFIHNDSISCKHLWNGTEICIDSHSAKGVRLQNLATLNFCTQCKFSWKTGEVYRNFLTRMVVLTIHICGIGLTFSLMAT